GFHRLSTDPDRGGQVVRRSAAAALPLLALVFGGTAQAATHPLEPIRDAYVDSDAPTTNFGASADLTIQNQGDQRGAYLTVDLTPLLKKKAKSATLTLVARNVTDGMGVSAFQVSDTSWDESTITYATAPALGAPLGTATAASDGATVTFTIN